MRIEQMHYLIEISKHKSLTSASQELFITPQALSLSIKSLEDQLHFQILERTALGVSLTKEGEALLALSELFINGLETLQENRRGHGANRLRGNMILAAPHGVSESYLPKLLEDLYHNHPQLKVESREYDYPEIIQAVMKGEVPFGLTYKTYINGQDIIGDIPESLIFTPFFECGCVCVANKKWPIAQYKTISLKTILKYPYVMYEPASYIFSRILAYGGMPKRIISASNTLIANQLISSGVGIGMNLLMGDSKTETLLIPDSVIIDLKEKVRLEFGYLILRGGEFSEETKAQLAYLRKYFRNKG